MTSRKKVTKTRKRSSVKSVPQGYEEPRLDPPLVQEIEKLSAEEDLFQKILAALPAYTITSELRFDQFTV